MNPETNRLEQLTETQAGGLLRPNGKPVPKHWTVLKAEQLVVVEGYTFKVAHIGEQHVLLEPVGPPVIGLQDLDLPSSGLSSRSRR